MHSSTPLPPQIFFPLNNLPSAVEAMDEDNPTDADAGELLLPAFPNTEIQLNTDDEQISQLWKKFRLCLQSISHQDHAQLKHYIGSAPDLRNILDEEGYPLAYYYIATNQTVNFEYLKELELNINLQDFQGRTPLHHAILLKIEEDFKYKLVEGLIKLGAEVDVPDNDDKAPLHYAVRQGLSHVISLLCEKGAKVNSQDELGNVAFHYAIFKKNVISGKSKDIIKTLHKHEANPNTQDRDGRTPLHLILLHFNALDEENKNKYKYSFITAIKALLKVGARKNIYDHCGRLVTTLDKNDLFKNIMGLPDDHPVSLLDFNEDFVAEHSPSLKAAQPWENIPKFAIITGPNGSGKSHLLAYTKAFLEKFGRTKIHYIYKDSQSLEKYAPAKDDFFHRAYSSSYYSSLSKKETWMIWQFVEILQNPSKVSSNEIVNSIVRQIQQIHPNTDFTTIGQDALKDIVVKHYITSQVRKLLTSEGSSNNLVKLIVQQIKHDKSSSNITDEEASNITDKEILKYGSRAIKMNKEPLHSFHALSELKHVFEEYVKKREKIFEKYSHLSHIETLLSAYSPNEKLQPTGEATSLFFEFIKNKKKLESLLNEIADDEIGAAPWIKLNEVFYENGRDLQLHYESIASGCSRTLYFTKKINGVEKTITIDQHDQLSAGERLILDILSWKYYIDKTDVVSKISMILLDEPDRHFDPELSKIFMNCLTHLSEEHNIQVMMTTHRTDTLAYAPEGSIFTIKRDKITNNASIQPTNRLHALFKLTPNLREITNFHIKVYTESFDDATFYEHVYKHILRLGEAKRKACAAVPDGLMRKPHKILSRRFQLSFYAVAMDYFGGGGGCAAVAKQVQIETLALANIANRSGTKSLADKRIDYPFGILDADTTLVKSKLAKQKTRQLNSQDKILEEEIKPRQLIDLRRHSLESYMYDPVLLCSLLTPDEIRNWIKDDKLKKFMLSCQDLITKPYDRTHKPEVKGAFNNYFRYFLEQFILKKPINDAPKYLDKYGYLNPERNLNTTSNSVDVLVTLREDLGLPADSDVSLIVEKLLQTQVKSIRIFTKQGTPSYTVQYPGFFIYMRGHNIEEFFQTTFFNWQCPQFNPEHSEFDEMLSMQFRKPERPNFKELLIYKIRNDPEICLPMDLVDTIGDLGEKVTNHTNSIIKPKQLLIPVSSPSI
jgi:ankyrin repeat protein/ABC-type lipoprotein export system ATPase subunit